MQWSQLRIEIHYCIEYSIHVGFLCVLYVCVFGLFLGCPTLGKNGNKNNNKYYRILIPLVLSAPDIYPH